MNRARNSDTSKSSGGAPQVDSLEYVLRSAQQTAAWGRRLGERLPVPGAVALCGTLGAGKTLLVQAVAQSFGIDSQLVISPTFTICNEYQGHAQLFHLDFYRVGDEDELWELGLEELWGRGLVLVEWADRFPAALPSDALWVRLDVMDATSRRARLNGPEWLLKELREIAPH